MESIIVDRNGRTAAVKAERRHTPRIPVNGLAYVNLAPDNGGIVLNVSEEGLCFQSRAPVHATETIRLWFSCRSRRIETPLAQEWTKEQSRRGFSRFIEVRSELAWIDDTRKRGGLRFLNPSAEARDGIRDWMHESTFPRINETPTTELPSVKRPSRRFVRFRSARVKELFDLVGTARGRTGFSGGLISGILLSAVLVALFSFLIKSHKLGDSLVRLGERLGGRPVSSALPANSRESLSNSPRPQPVPLQPESVSAAPQKALPSAIPELPTDKLSFMASPPPTKSPDGKTGTESHNTEGHNSRPVGQTAARPAIPRIPITPTTVHDENILIAAAPEVPVPGRLDVRSEPLKVGGAATGPEKYLEVGKFKEKSLADTLLDRLSQLSFPAKVSQGSRFFGKSYQVLVGPYGSDSDAEAVHKDLSSHGFTPRSYERGKRDFNLRTGLKVGATRLPVGPCVISWESYIPDTIVKIETLRGPNVTLEGKWVPHSDKYVENAIAYVKDRDGYLSLLEIRFSGLTEALVFGGESKH